MTEENKNISIEKKVSSFIESKPQSITLDINQLENLKRIEIEAYILWEDIEKFNKEIGNTHEPDL